MKKLAVIFGGKSTEHQVSLQSAKSVISALDKGKYDLLLIGVDKDGGFRLMNPQGYLVNDSDPSRIELQPEGSAVLFSPGKKGIFVEGQGFAEVDVVFPLIHGNGGEDGCLQGLLRLLEIPFVGSDVLGSAVCMDKDVAKRLMQQAGIPTAQSLCLTSVDEIPFSLVSEKLGQPVFIKPANGGSSVGVSRADTEEEYQQALAEAFAYDGKVLVEESIEGRELEVSVLGNQNPMASLPGEIVPKGGFYDYRAKYIDSDGAGLVVPVSLDDATVRDIQILAIKAYKTLGCEGMARCDFFLFGENELYLNEINTIPGFTSISMYPKLWEASGLSYPELLDRLVEHALDRFQKLKVRNTER